MGWVDTHPSVTQSSPEFKIGAMRFTYLQSLNPYSGGRREYICTAGCCLISMPAFPRCRFFQVQLDRREETPTPRQAGVAWMEWSLRSVIQVLLAEMMIMADVKKPLPRAKSFFKSGRDQ